MLILILSIVGTIFTIVGAIAGVRQLKARHAHVELPPRPIEIAPSVEELDSETEWVDAQVEAIRAANYSVSLCLHTIHASDEIWKAERVNAAIGNARSERGVEVRVLAAANPPRVRGPYELEFQLDAEVRFAPEIAHYDLRFLLIDSDRVVLGVADPDREHGAYRQTYSWAVLRSPSLCEALERDFQRMWLSSYAVTLSKYCADTIKQAGLAPSARLASDLGITYEAAKRFADQDPISAILDNFALLFYGKSSSGKSSLMRHLARAHGAKCMDLRDLRLPYVHRYGASNLGSEPTDGLASDLITFCRRDAFDAVELFTDLDELAIAEVVKAVESHGRRPVLVHCALDPGIALKRNESRSLRMSPTSILRQEEHERAGMFRKVCDNLHVPILELAASERPSVCYEQLLTKIKTVHHDPYSH